MPDEQASLRGQIGLVTRTRFAEVPTCDLRDRAHSFPGGITLPPYPEGRTAMKFAPCLIFVMTAPALAHDWRADRAETAAEMCRARYEARLDCYAIQALLESQRMSINASAPAA